MYSGALSPHQQRTRPSFPRLVATIGSARGAGTTVVGSPGVMAHVPRVPTRPALVPPAPMRLATPSRATLPPVVLLLGPTPAAKIRVPVAWPSAAVIRADQGVRSASPAASPAD